MGHWYRAESQRSRQIDRASDRRIAAEVNVIRQPPYHRAYLYQAFMRPADRSRAVMRFSGSLIDCFFQQCSGVCLKSTAIGGSLPCEFILNLRTYIESDGHGCPLPHYAPIIVMLDRMQHDERNWRMSIY